MKYHVEKVQFVFSDLLKWQIDVLLFFKLFGFIYI